MFVLTDYLQARITQILGSFDDAMEDFNHEINQGHMLSIMESYHRARVVTSELEDLEHPFPELGDNIIFQAVHCAMLQRLHETVARVRIIA